MSSSEDCTSASHDSTRAADKLATDGKSEKKMDSAPTDKDDGGSKKPDSPVILSDDDQGPGAESSKEPSWEKKPAGGDDPGSPSEDILPDQIIHCCPLCKEKSCLEDMVLHLTKHENFYKDTSSQSRSKFSYLNGSYICSSCPYRTSYRMMFTEHVRHHVVLYPYSCLHCKVKVKGITSLLKHHKETHSDKLIKLEIHTSKLLGNIMSKLGPQAPAADDVLTLSKSQVRPRPIKPSEAPTGKTIVIDDEEDGEKKPEQEQEVSSSLGLKIDSVMSIAGASEVQATTPETSPPNSPVSEIRPGRNQPVKIQGLVGCPAGKGDGKTTVEIFIKVPDENGDLQATHVNFGVRGQFYVCLACNYETPSMDEFKTHMFAEIHCSLYKSLQKPCHSCGQQGVGHDRHVKPCPFVEELMKNIQKAKENAEKKNAEKKQAATTSGSSDETESDTTEAAKEILKQKAQEDQKGRDSKTASSKSSPESATAGDKATEDSEDTSASETPKKSKGGDIAREDEGGESPMDLGQGDSSTTEDESSSGSSTAQKGAKESLGKSPKGDNDSDTSDTLPDLPSSDIQDTTVQETNDAIFETGRIQPSDNESGQDSVYQRKRKRSAGRYAFSNGVYHCYTCPFQSEKTKTFRTHVWKHIHGKSFKCEHCPENIKYNYFQFCYLINGVMTLVHRMADWKEERIKQGLPVTIIDYMQPSSSRSSLNGRVSSTELEDTNEAMEVASEDEEKSASTATADKSAAGKNPKDGSITETMTLLRRLSDAQTTEGEDSGEQQSEVAKTIRKDKSAMFKEKEGPFDIEGK